MKIAELREMSDEQVSLTLKEAAETLFKLRIQAQTERVDNPSEQRKQRRLIARLKTLQTERGTAATVYLCGILQDKPGTHQRH
jgi:large subunit ribosomal protein L29